MPLYGALTFFILLFILSLGADYTSKKNQKQFLIVFYCICVYAIGSRTWYLWIDTAYYYGSFLYSTNDLFSFSFSDPHFGYSEDGYYLLCVIAKTISSNPQFYLYFIGAISMFFIFKSLWKYSPLPVLGLFIYVARFMMGRDMNQMRGGVAIGIVILATVYCTEQKFWKYLFTIIVAYFIHRSALVALPLYFMNKVNITRKHIYWGMAAAFLIAGVFGGLIKDIIGSIGFIQNIAGSYVQEGSVKAWSNDLSNPMIYFQGFILVAFTMMEKQIAPLSNHYYTLRNGYFYSFLLLTILCQYGVVAGRTSTIFATFEMIIYPLIIVGWDKKSRWMPYIWILVAMIYFFISKYHGGE